MLKFIVIAESKNPVINVYVPNEVFDGLWLFGNIKYLSYFTPFDLWGQTFKIKPWLMTRILKNIEHVNKPTVIIFDNF